MGKKQERKNIAQEQVLGVLEQQRGQEEAWRHFIPLCGSVARFDSGKDDNPRVFVITHTYIEEKAAKKLSLPLQAIREAVQAGDLPSFVDPNGVVRIPAEAVEAALANKEMLERISRHAKPPLRPLPLAAPKQERSKGRNHWLSRTERKRLSRQLHELFPTWESYNREDQRITLHLGPTNSGKTYQSLQQLIEAGSGWYLAPLRLLAHEVFDTLNKQGVPCNLLTGEERIRVEGARITAATIEMFDPHHSGACVVIDEAHMLSDSQRGWAWTRAIMETRSPEVHIIGAPIVEPLVQAMADEAGFSISVESYERLTPLEVAPAAWSLAKLPPKTILVAFSRRTVLALKTDLEKIHHRSVSVIYGNLPPEVRLKQAERFARGETEICVATDAIGMGLNLPADNVCFYETSKFDGSEVRQLNANEIRQIAGRAGRYGLSKNGWVGALNKADLGIIRAAVTSEIADIEYARVAPTPESIALLPGQLYEKLEKWVRLAGIPPKWKEIIKPVDLSAQIELARLLDERDVSRLGEEMTMTLINAPSYKETQDYWLLCAKAIIRGRPMPLPDRPSRLINSAEDLERHEIAIRCADIYLWLAQREGFAESGPLEEEIRALRQEWAAKLDAALRKKIDTARRCRDCGRSLQTGYPYNICQRCYRERRYNRYYE